MTNEELVKAIAKWVKKNSERESGWLSPEPQWIVNPHELLDYVSTITGISKDKIGEWVSEDD